MCAQGNWEVGENLNVNEQNKNHENILDDDQVKFTSPYTRGSVGER